MARHPFILHSLLVILLILIPFGVFGRVQHFDFVNWDDDIYVSENPFIKNFYPESVLRWFTRPQVKLFVPLPMMSYALDYQLYGEKPGGYHRTNLLVHILNILLVYLIFNRIFGDPLLSFLGALLFGLHPVQVESVAWISERKNLLSAFFSLLAFASFVRRVPAARGQLVSGTLFLFFLGALLSKITAVMLPFVCLAYHLLYGEKGTRQAILRYLYFLVPVAASGILTLALYPGLQTAYHENRILDLLLMPFYFYFSYLKAIVYPVGLELFHPVDTSAVLKSWILGACVVSGMIILAAVIRAALRKQKQVFWMIWFLLWLAPVSTLIRVPLGDHHLYLPAVGLIGFLISALMARRGMLVFLLLLGNGIAVPLASARLAVWQNGETLWRSVLDRHPRDYRALIQLADYYQSRNQTGQAAEIYQRLIALYPGEPFPHINLANLYLAARQTQKAREAADSFEKYHPHHAELFLVRGAIADREGKHDEAMQYLEKAEGLDPSNTAVLLNLGKRYFGNQEFERAIPIFEKLLSVDDSIPEVYYLLGLSRIALKQWQAASSTLERMTKKGFHHVGLHFHLGYAYLKSGQRRKAETEYRKSTVWDPGLSEAFYHLGLLALEEKKFERAKSFLEKALALKPHAPNYLKMLELTEREREKSAPAR